MSVFDRYLSVWIARAILAGIVIAALALVDAVTAAEVVSVTLVEVPVVLLLAAVANRTRGRFA